MNPTGTLVQQFSVPFRYDIVFTHGVFRPDNRALVDVLCAREPARRHRALVVVDGGVAAAQPGLCLQIQRYFETQAEKLELVTPPIVVPGGEAVKNDTALVQRIHSLIYAHHIDRKAFVLIVGGGAVLDAVGYAAATAHRGVRTVRLPTTVLSQNDSGVGVKNGINAFNAKNYLGTFFPPYAVLNDFDLLATLPRRDRVAGFAEAVKVALLRDPEFFDWLDDNATALAAGDPDRLAVLVRRSAELHAQHIACGGDPFELGSAKPLDFGHWSAHKLESLTEHELRHGEAVAIGLLLDCKYAAAIGVLPGSTAKRVEDVLVRLGLPVWHDALDLRDANLRRSVLGGIEDFREHLGGELTVTLISAPGSPLDVHTIEENTLEAVLTEHARTHSRAATPRRGARAQ